MGNYYTWRGDRVTVTPYKVMSGRHGWTEFAIERTLPMPDWLHDKFQSVIYANGWQQRDQWQRNFWIHLYDAVQCETVSPNEALEALEANCYLHHLTARASNYMHLVSQ